jgi:hypothetical protein
MRCTIFLKILAEATVRSALFALCICLILHLIAAVCTPVLQAFGEGLHRVNAVQVVAVSQESTDLGREIVR